MAVGEDEVELAVVVVVEEFEPPAAEEPGGLGDFVRARDIAKGFVFLVAVEREALLVDVGDEEVLVAAAEEIGGIDAHAGSGLAFLAEGNFGGERDLFELAVAAVGVEEILHRVVGDEEVHEAVVVDVGGDHAKAFAERAGNARALLRRCERAIAVIVIEEAGGGLKEARNAVVLLAELVVAAGVALAGAVVDETADEEIELAVVIVVEPDCAGGETRRLETGLFGDVGESAVAVVAIENAVAV